MKSKNDHIPVMQEDVMVCLSPRADATYVDATFGRGGYTRALLQKGAGFVVAIDRDPEAISYGRSFEKEFEGRFRLCEGCFGEMRALLSEEGIQQVEGVVFDVGVSSPQLDNQERGFSFQGEAPLDMRMEKKGKTAADLVNTLDESEIATLLWTYGEEGRSRVIARSIVKRRSLKPFSTTKELADLVRSVYPKGYYKTHPATKTFQALRIAVNDELGELKKGLLAAEELLAPGGILVVVTFHSLEERIVKTFFKERSLEKKKVSRLLPGETEKVSSLPTFDVIEKKPRVPSDREVEENPRARSAKLRWGIRTEYSAEGKVA